MKSGSASKINPNTYLIGIAGGSGSGKTSFIRELRSYFTEQELCILSQDDYYKDRESQIRDENQVQNFDLPESILTNEMIRDIGLLQQGNVVERKEYVFNNDKAIAKSLHFVPAPVIIVEGLFVFHHKELMDAFNLRIFLQAKENLKVIRRIKRDQIERNYPLEDVLYRYERHVLPAYEQYIEPYKNKADILVNNNHSFHSALEVIVGFIRYRLSLTKTNSDPVC